MLDRKSKLDLTKRKLIEATQQLLYEKGNDFKGITSRELAKTAGVPLGMINYCFGSKDNLVLRVFLDTYEKKWEEGDSCLPVLEESGDPKEELKIGIFKIIKIFLVHFNKTEFVLRYLITDYDASKELKSFSMIKKYYGDSKSDEECRKISYELGVVFQLAVLRHKEYKEHFGIDLLDDKQLMLYIDEQIERFIC